MESKLENFLQTIAPNYGEIQFDPNENLFFTYVFDAELDPVKIIFEGDYEFRIETEDITYVSFDTNVMNQITSLLDEAEVFISDNFHLISK